MSFLSLKLDKPNEYHRQQDERETKRANRLKWVARIGWLLYGIAMISPIVLLVIYDLKRVIIAIAYGIGGVIVSLFWWFVIRVIPNFLWPDDDDAK